MSINTVRHQEIFDCTKYDREKIVIVGLGAIGSRVGENLVSTGLTNLTFIDFDEVESHNLANQLYIRSDIGRSKISAFKSWAENKVGSDAVNEMTFINGKVDEQTVGWFKDASIVVSCVDSFSARRLVMSMAQKAWADLFIDTRMATGHCAQHMVTVDSTPAVKAWEATLGEDGSEDFERSSCGSSLSVGVTAQTIGAVASWSIMNYLKTGFIDPILRVDTAPWLINRIGG